MADTRIDRRGDHELLRALVKRADGYRERAPVFGVQPAEPQRAVKDAVGVAARLWPWMSECEFRPNNAVSAGALAFFLPDDGRLSVYVPSGAVAAVLRSITARGPIASDDRRVNRDALRDKAHEIASAIAKPHLAADEELRFERLWETKGRGVTTRGESTPTTLFSVTGTFRRWVHGLPVLGRPSVLVTLAKENAVAKWGVDWRPIRSQPIANASVLDPEAGATRLLDDIAWRRPEKPFTLEDFEPIRFSLCYVTQPRRSEQRVLQPSWLAVFAPRGFTSMGIVAAVPAAPQAFEPMGRPMRAGTTSL